MTQLELAGLAGVTSDTIAKIEQGKRGWSLRTARDVMEALARSRPMNESEAYEYMVQAELVQENDGHLPADVLLNLMDKGIVRDASRVPQRKSSIPSPVEDVFRACVGRFGSSKVEAMLRTMLALADDQSDGDAEPVLINVLEPPVQRVGHTEQTIRTYEDRRGKLSKPAASKRRRA